MPGVIVTGLIGMAGAPSALARYLRRRFIPDGNVWFTESNGDKIGRIMTGK